MAKTIMAPVNIWVLARSSWIDELGSLFLVFISKFPRLGFIDGALNTL